MTTRTRTPNRVGVSLAALNARSPRNPCASNGAGSVLVYLPAPPGGKPDAVCSLSDAQRAALAAQKNMGFLPARRAFCAGHRSEHRDE